MKELILDDGSTYKGDVLNGVPHGKGIRISSEGHKYDGDFLNGKFHGKGKMTWINPDASYEGDWLDGKRTGKGEYQYSNGNSYVGDFLDGKRHGKGTYLMYIDSENLENSIRIAEGEFLEDEFLGFLGNITKSPEWYELCYFLLFSVAVLNDGDVSKDESSEITNQIKILIGDVISSRPNLPSTEVNKYLKGYVDALKKQEFIDWFVETEGLGAYGHNFKHCVKLLKENDIWDEKFKDSLHESMLKVTNADGDNDKEKLRIVENLMNLFEK